MSDRITAFKLAVYEQALANSYESARFWNEKVRETEDELRRFVERALTGRNR